MSHWHSMEVGQVLKELNTDLHKGLSVEEAHRRLEKYGPNELKKGEPVVSRSHRSITQLKTLLVILLFIVAVVSVFVPLVFPGSTPANWIAWLR